MGGPGRPPTYEDKKRIGFFLTSGNWTLSQDCKEQRLVLSLFSSVGIFHRLTVQVVQYLTCGRGMLPAPFVKRLNNTEPKINSMMKTDKFFAWLLAPALLLAACGDDDKPQSGDFGEIQVPDLSQIEQTAGADDPQTPSGVTFTTQDAWSSSIRETRADTPGWITISPDHGDTAGTYTIRITLEPNTGEEARTAVITITCGSSHFEITVTQEAPEEESDIRQPNGRLARITEYENGKPEYYTVFTYDKEGWITSVITYNNADLTDPYEAWEFSYPAYDSSKITVTETHYDKTPAYGYVWACEGGFHTPNGSTFDYATGTSLLNENEVRRFSYEYNEHGLDYVEKDFFNDGGLIPDYTDKDLYVYESEYNCTRIQKSVESENGGVQEFTYDENVSKRSPDYERLFLNSGYRIDPSLYVIEEADMFRFLGFCGNASTLLPVKVKTQWKNQDATTETITYQYKNPDNWKIGQQIDGMEITVTNSDSNVKRFVLTFDGI